MPAASQPLVDTNRARWEAGCKACGWTFPISEAETAELLDLGWPVCCGRNMTILYHPNGVPTDDPPVAG